MTRFIELSGYETGVRYVVNVGHIVSVRHKDDGAVVLLSNDREMAVRESCGVIICRIEAATEVQP